MQAMEARLSENQRLLYSIEDACGVLGGISRTTLFRLTKRGVLQGCRIGRRSLITAESLQEYVRTLDDRTLAESATAGGR